MDVTVAAYSAAWPDEFQQEALVLQERLAPWLSGGLEHVGSTAVPGLAAKPVLDMLAPVSDLVLARDAVPVLAELGYRHADHRPDEALWFFRQPGTEYDTRTHQLHLTCAGSRLWRERLAFRDALRADDGLRQEYARLKRTLSPGADLVTYTDGKRAFVSAVLRPLGLEL